MIKSNKKVKPAAISQKPVSRITKQFLELCQSGKKAFVPFITAGDPDLATTEALIGVLAKSGASVIELGVPFSDPMADGPVIQKSSERALKNHVHLCDILALVARVRQTLQTPILLMGYYNPLLQYGLEKFAIDAEAAGVDGVLVVDLPPEEAAPLREVLANCPIDIIYLLAPTSNKQRIDLVKRYGSGFVYYVSITGVTGAAHMDPAKVAKSVKPVIRGVGLPVCIGFGISKPEHVAQLSPLGAGVVVGSSLVKLIEEQTGQPDLLATVGTYVDGLVGALK